MSRWSLLAVLALGCSALPACDVDEDEDGISGTPGDGSNRGGYWARNDGSQAYLSLGSGVAKACANGTETVGTFDASAPSMTFVIGSDTLVFPLRFDGTDTLLVGVPKQGIDTNTATYYVRTATYPCGGTSSGGGSSGGSTTPATGTFNIRIYNPTGACTSDQPYHKAFKGSIYTTVWNNGTSAMGNVFANQIWPTSTTSTTASWSYTVTSASKIEWELWPDATVPSYCVQRGSAIIDSQGQAKSVEIRFQ